jgi:hypothetical protein
VKDRLLRLGRQNNIYMIITAHLSTDYQKTRVILSECHKFIVFPDKGNWTSIQRLLNVYVGLDTQTVALIKRLPSRWVLIHRNYPQYLVYESGAYIIHEKSEKICGPISQSIEGMSKPIPQPIPQPMVRPSVRSRKYDPEEPISESESSDYDSESSDYYSD